MTLTPYLRPQLGLRSNATDLWSQLQGEIDRLFEGSTGGLGTQFFNVWAPALDVYEEKDNLVVCLEAPGLKKEDFEIALHDGVLSISGERRLDDKRSKASGYRTERFTGRFQRSITLPKAVQVDNVRASYKDGILTVRLPIAEEARPKQIVVSTE